MKVHTSYGELL